MADERKLITDDLDFFLLDVVSTGGIGLPVFDIPNLDECLNRDVPEHTRTELIAALEELFERGDLEARVQTKGGRQRTGLRLNADEIEAAIAGAFRASYWLTAQGGSRWAEHTGIDWQRWDDDWQTSHVGCITTASREFTEFLFERKVRAGEARGPGRWRELRPWKATYWHTEPVGFEVRYRTKDVPRIKDDIYPFVWQQNLPGRGAPRGLAARRSRALKEKARPFEKLTERQLERRLWERSPRANLAAAMEIAMRADGMKRMLSLLHSGCPVWRYCAAKALGARNVVEAVDALMGVVFHRQDVAAVEALGRIRDPRTLAPLLVLYEWWHGYASFDDPQFFAELERAIVAFGDEAIGRIEALMLEKRISPHRAFGAMGRSRSRRAVEFMAHHIGSDSYPVMGLMARMGDEARAKLFEYAGSEQEGWGTAAWALARTPGAFCEEARRMLDTTRKPADVLRRRVAFLLTREATYEGDVVQALLPLLSDSDCAKRRAAVDLLVELGAKEAAGEVAKLARDERWAVRASVARALHKWGACGEVLEELRRDPDIIVRGCALYLS